MTYWFAVITIWTSVGLQTIRSDVLESEQVCKKLLAADIAERQKIFDFVKGECISTPEKPAWAPAPEIKGNRKQLTT